MLICDVGHIYKMKTIELYHLEKYLFETVSPRFEEDKKLSAFDFFCIIIWKANRAKSKVAKRLIERDPQKRKDLDAIIRDFTSCLYKADDSEERLKLLMVVWGFRLPMASAILTVLWPEDFTVYDIRVCESLKAHHKLGNKVKFEKIWEGYKHFKHDVEKNTPSELSLRDKDRYLWGQSFQDQLTNDIKQIFPKKK